MINVGCMPVALSSRMCYRISTVNLFALTWLSLNTKNGWLCHSFSPGTHPHHPRFFLWFTTTTYNHKLHLHVLLIKPGRIALSKLCKSPLILPCRWHLKYKLTLEHSPFCLYEARVNWKSIPILLSHSPKHVIHLQNQIR